MSQKCTGCGNCYFKKTRFVGSRGNPNARLMIIGESPGSDELITGEPFTGPSGSILQKELERLGLGPDDYFITNALQCLPVKFKTADQNKKHTNAAVSVCRHRLLEEIELAPRRMILCLGNAALSAVTNNFDHKITQVRGRIFKSEFAEVGVLGTVHPAFLLRGGGGFTQKFRDDVAYAAKIAKGMSPKKWTPPKYQVLDDVEDFAELRQLLRKDHDEFVEQRMDEMGRWPYPTISRDKIITANDIETSGFRFRTDDILCSGISSHPDRVYIVPEALTRSEEYLRLYDDPDFHYIWQNGKFDIKFLHSYGCHGAYVHDDTMLMSYARNENRGIHDLDQIAADTIGAPPHKGVLDKYLPNKRTSYRAVPRKLLHRYLAYDVSKTRGMFEPLYMDVYDDEENRKAYFDLYIPASALITEVEEAGLQSNPEQIAINGKIYRKKIREARQAMDEHTLAKFGQTYNPASPMQMKELLCYKLQLGDPEDGTGADALDAMEQVEEVKLLKAYRKAAKLYGTYVRPLLPVEALTKDELKKYQKGDLKHYVEDDGRVYATYLIHGTRTGRLSSRNPNQQNQPRQMDIRDQFRGRWFKDIDAFMVWYNEWTQRWGPLNFSPDELIINPDGSIQFYLMEVDYNQAELRSLAQMSKDPELTRIYTDPNAMSLHWEVSVDLWGESWLERYSEKNKYENPDDYNLASTQYIRTKAVNFGIVYGRTAFDLADEFEIPVSEAQAMIDGWSHKFSKAWDFIQKCREAPTRGITMKTIYGRRKRATYASKANMVSLQNEAANFPHQSTASDFTLDSAIVLNPQLKPYGTSIVNLVHDAIYNDIPPVLRIAKEVGALTQQVMESTPIKKGITDIPFTADPELGITWGHKKGDKWEEILPMKPR